LHAFWARRIACWDVAAGLLIAREAGAVIGPFGGAGERIPLDDPAFLAASTPALHAFFHRLFAAGDDGQL
jgi:fructose-1,6-bisphosphatase/inositol monophosphatase family enzyme